MEAFVRAETVIIELLLIVSLVAIAVRRLRVPYTVALVVAGLIITLQQPFQIELTPELIMAIFVPPLVFEAAFYINLNELRRNLLSISILAVPGVIVTTLIVGGIVAFGVQLSLGTAMIFGALIAATDPIAVVAMLRQLGVPKRLGVLLEGESLFNDGTAIVTFGIVVTAVVAGQFNLLQGFNQFVRVSLGGVAVGLVLGLIVAALISRVDDYLIEITLTTVLAFGAYVLAERLNFSGVLAVVAAGLVNGNLGPHGMSPTTRIVLTNFWEYVAFLANSIVFLLIGLDVNIRGLIAAWQPIAWAILAILFARFVVVFGFGWLVNRFVDPVPIRWQLVLWWGGLRGAISLALALSLPAVLGAERNLLQLMTFGIVLFTLLVQAMTMRPFVKLLGIVRVNEDQLEYERRHARLVAMRSAEHHLENLHRQGLVSTHTMEQLRPELEYGISNRTRALRKVMRTNPELEAEELDTTRRELLRAQRSAFMGLRRDGMISEDVFTDLVSEVDNALQSETVQALDTLDGEIDPGEME